MRRMLLVALSTVLVVAGCAPVVVGSEPGPRRGDVVVVGDRGKHRGPRGLTKVPPGHYPPPGHCRIWHAGRPPGHQPPPTRCGALLGRVPPGAFILYNDTAWDTGYDWRGHERRRPGSVPEIILDLVRSLDGG